MSTPRVKTPAISLDNMKILAEASKILRRFEEACVPDIPPRCQDARAPGRRYRVTDNPRFDLHTHPRMEDELHVPPDHCIIDRNVFELLASRHTPR